MAIMYQIIEIINTAATIVTGMDICKFASYHALKVSCHDPALHKPLAQVPPYPQGEPSISGVCSRMH
jgi:hypothetical protein